MSKMMIIILTAMLNQMVILVPQAMLSPVFKSAAARAIIEEERKTPVNIIITIDFNITLIIAIIDYHYHHHQVQIIPKARKKPMKKRHMTISGSQPAVQVESLESFKDNHSDGPDDHNYFNCFKIMRIK